MLGLTIRFNVAVFSKQGTVLKKFQVEAQTNADAHKIVQDWIKSKYAEEVDYKISLKEIK